MFTEGLFNHKIVLVTGASRGIGAEIAKAFAKLGATVVGTATTAEGAQIISERFANANLKGIGMSLNVNDMLSIEKTINDIKSTYGAVNILINNAAITKDNLFLRLKDEEWSQVIDTDLTAVYRLSKLCIRDMLKNRWGRIINIGSVVGATGNPGQANYCAAKAGVVGLSKALALEVGSRNITVNTIAPGFITTDMTNVLSDDQRETIFARIPMQRGGKAGDISAAAIYLASPAGDYITGQTLHVNGGMYMN